MLFFNLVLGLNGGDMEGVIKGILKDVLPDL
jgi:hypothetical protein